MSKKVIIRAQNLCKTYNSGSEQYHAIRNVDLDIYEGEFTVIMGNSGSGKSTLLYLLSGLDQITAGEVYFRDQRIDAYSEREMSNFRTRRIGYIYQSINLVPDLSIKENIALPGYIAGNKKKDILSRVAELMNAMDIDGQRNRLPSQTSGGQQQRAAIARALINSPDIIFADEPTGSLNMEHGTAVLDILTDIHRKGQSVVMVTHDIKAACRADRLIYIQDGKIGGILEFDTYDEHQIQDREAIIFALVTGKE
ncbi:MULTISPECIES: ABC transporter ATP-binding protein [unclassified Paenibacillus]|uniref:ABC transporter ATP-binding protein n=1 Tax=unclassified Paenibacillus TaxID=185978 RepID=UPI000CFB791F|nr:MULTISPECIES: ABC transporter ATP-binding protein [unclassified Paenibacillus]PQZ99888.1 ABC transporter ATP-binding protein [Paenibacillus sp. MYb63]PRA44112.1 ABC transporter ATP-binding protein [Paenibacillus sp. MYb67]QZN76390.1 ABC transporter ATP-binding protein [Paenibacillus sp. DR312]